MTSLREKQHEIFITKGILPKFVDFLSTCIYIYGYQCFLTPTIANNASHPVAGNFNKKRTVPLAFSFIFSQS